MTDILISAGHHPDKPGATMGDFVEHAEAVIWCERIYAILHAGQDVTVARVPVGVLREKVEYINRVRPLLAVEIHFNDAWIDRNGDGVVQDGERVGRGCETLYAPGSARGRLAAELIQHELARVFPPDRGVKEGWYRMDPKFGPNFFLARTTCPAVIIEPEFVANAQTIRDRREDGSAAIAGAIISIVRAWSQ